MVNFYRVSYMITNTVERFNAEISYVRMYSESETLYTLLPHPLTSASVDPRRPNSLRFTLKRCDDYAAFYM